MLRRLEAKGDPWADIASFARGLGEARKKPEKLAPEPSFSRSNPG